MIKFCNEAADLYLENCVGEVFTSVIEWHKYLICFQEKLFFLPADVFCQVVRSMNVGWLAQVREEMHSCEAGTLGSSWLLTCQF